MRTIARQPAVGVLEQADEIEQRGDVRIALTVVIAEQTFVVAYQAGEHIRRNQLPVVRETLGRSQLNSAIVAARMAETSNVGKAAGHVFSGCLTTCPTTSWVEDEVRVAIVERTVLDHVLLSAVKTACADR